MSLKIPVTPPGIDPGTVRQVVQRLNHYATPGPAETMAPTDIRQPCGFWRVWFCMWLINTGPYRYYS